MNDNLALAFVVVVVMCLDQSIVSVISSISVYPLFESMFPIFFSILVGVFTIFNGGGPSEACHGNV